MEAKWGGKKARLSEKIANIKESNVVFAKARGRIIVERIIVDFPIDDENKIELYLILFDVCDCEIVKAIAAMIQKGREDIFLGIVNVFARGESATEKCDSAEDVKNESFWHNLMRLKFHDPSFDKIAFLDLDVPVESPYILNFRSQLIFDQFCHFIYDFEDIKSAYRDYCKRLNVLNVHAESDRELRQLEKHLNEFPLCMLSVERIYRTLVEQILSPGDDQSSGNAGGRRQSSLSKQSRMSFEIAAFGKVFRDMTDKWRRGCEENSKIYSQEIVAMEMRLHDIIWGRSAAAAFSELSIQRRQILNYFVKVLAEELSERKELQQQLEFYIYIMEFMRWERLVLSSKQQQEQNADKEFYENRSIMRKGKASCKQKQHNLKRTASDIYVDYNNTSRIPIEIEQLIDDRLTLRDIYAKDFSLQLYSQAAMLQRLNDLMDADKNYQSQHFKLFDVMLLKFRPSEVPKVFSSRSYRKVLPTLVCFRDFHDYLMVPRQQDVFIGQRVEVAAGDKRATPYETKDFLLETSIKRKLLQKGDEKTHKTADSATTKEETKPTEIAKDDDHESVYAVSNKYTEFNVNESEFNSQNFHVKIQIFNWLNCEEHLNLSATLNDVHFSFSQDSLHGTFNGGGIATLQDERTKMICSIDLSDARKMSLTTPHGMRMRIDDANFIEFDWMSESEAKVADETKRIFFANGYVMIYMMSNENPKVYSPTGTIYEISSSKRPTSTLNKCTTSQVNQNLTKLHHFSITSLHFLTPFINISSYTMTLSCGNRYRVENDSIVDEMKPTLAVRARNFDDDGEYGGESFYATREDGLKILSTQEKLRCLFPDGTLITTRIDSENLTSVYAASMVETNPKQISILDEIWLSDASKCSKIVLDELVDDIGSDYFLCINREFQFEHRFYGRIRFNENDNAAATNGNCEIEMYNGLRIKRSNNGCMLISLKNGVQLRLSEHQLQFSDGKCSECDGFNKLVINISNNNNKNDDDDVCENTRLLACANDIDGNSFEIQQQGESSPQVLFYDAWQYKGECRNCLQAREKFVMQHSGEQWVIVNRDMTGYEVLPYHSLSTADAWIETNETLLYSSSEKYEVDIDDKDLHIDMSADDDIIREHGDETSIKTEVESNLKRKSKQSVDEVTKTNDKKKKKSTTPPQKNKKREGKRRTTKLNSKEEEIEKALPTPPWVTTDPSITADISLQQRELIEFYVNPLEELPQTIDIGSMLKLQRDNFDHVTRALHSTRKYCDGNFILNVSGLMTSPVHKKAFNEHFEFIVRKSIEGYIARKLEHFRCAMARAIIEDLLTNAFKVIDVAAADAVVETHRCEVVSTLSEGETLRASSAVPIAIKSFSFV